MTPKVSIVIPVYNGSNYLKEAIDSALAQTYKNIEIVVVNDGSNDEGATEQIAKSYGKKIRYYSKKNGGVATALNLGIEKMTGEYFSWLSHDDMYYKDKIEKQVELLGSEGNTNIIVASNYTAIYPDGLKIRDWIHEPTFKFVDIFLATSAVVGLNGCCLLIPKEAFTLYGKFDKKLRVTQDYDLWFRLKDHYDFKLLKDHLVLSRRHPEQDSAKLHNILVVEADKMHCTFLKSINPERFKVYFTSDARNIDHMYNNYSTYAARGYNKTASELLVPILKYFHENNRARLYRVLREEIENPVSRGLGRFESSDDVFEALYEEIIQTGKLKLREKKRTDPSITGVNKLSSRLSRLVHLVQDNKGSFTLKYFVVKLCKKPFNLIRKLSE